MRLSNLVDEVEFKLILGSIRSKRDLLKYLDEIDELDKSDSIYLEMSRRKMLINAIYPFSESDGFFSFSGEILTSNPYLWILLVSLKSNIDHTLNASILDTITTESLKSIYGKNCKVLNFSSPLRYGSKRPNHFAEAIKYLGKELGLTTCEGYKIPNRKDGGVDLIAYNNILGTKALTVTLVQTTTQVKFLEKINDVDIKLWQNWVDFGPEPTRMLVSSMVATDADLLAAHASGIVFLDRLRIIELLLQGNAKLKFDNIFIDLFNKHYCIESK